MKKVPINKNYFPTGKTISNDIYFTNTNINKLERETLINSPTQSQSCISIYRKCWNKTSNIITKSQYAKWDDAEQPTINNVYKIRTNHFECALLIANRPK